ncbi:MAG TPA: hypothetical protein VMN39_04825, partial [Longimicrobiaceae bacterium]|nr:hypothetical protein [Longimicrobiaceae bacterium]
LLHSPLRIRRRVVEANLALAFPDAADAWRAYVARESYRHLGREAVSMFRLSSLDGAAVGRSVEIPDEDWRAFQEARAEGKGVILATGHYGNWELAAAAVAARGVPIETIVKRMGNPLVERRIAAVRRALGIGTVDMGEAPRRIPRALAAGKAIGIAADQNAPRSGLWVPFFGVPASAHRGPALFALRLQAPIFAAVCRRLPDGRYLLTGSRLPVDRTDSLEDDVVRLTAALATHLEGVIRSDPTQYLWAHNRWKTAPPEEPGPRESGTTSHGGRGAAAP